MLKESSKKVFGCLSFKTAEEITLLIWLPVLDSYLSSYKKLHNHVYSKEINIPLQLNFDKITRMTTFNI